MTNISTIVDQLHTISKTGLYGSPKNANFIGEISKNYFKNVSSPIKAAAFAKFYKEYNKKKMPVYKPLPQIQGTEGLKKMLKDVKKPTKGKKAKKSPKTQSPDFNAIAKAAAKAKSNYYTQMNKASLK